MGSQEKDWFLEWKVTQKMIFLRWKTSLCTDGSVLLERKKLMMYEERRISGAMFLTRWAVVESNAEEEELTLDRRMNSSYVIEKWKQNAGVQMLVSTWLRAWACGHPSWLLQCSQWNRKQCHELKARMRKGKLVVWREDVNGCFIDTT